MPAWLRPLLLTLRNKMRDISTEKNTLSVTLFDIFLYLTEN